MFRISILFTMALLAINQLSAQTDKLAMNYQEFGVGQKETLLIIHGFPGNATDWIPVANELASEYHVILPHLIGFGESTYHDLTFEQIWYDRQAAAIAEIISLAEVDSISIIAHDFGVPIAVELDCLLGDKVDKMIIHAGNTSSNPPLNTMMKAVSKPIIGGIAKAFMFSKFSLNMMRSMGTKKGKQKPTKNTKLERKAIKTIFATSLEDMAGYFRPVESKVRRTETPILLIWGEKDPFFDVSHAEYMAKSMKQANVIVFEAVGHYAFIEDKEKFVATVKDFVNGN